jgi:hypothetical protein
VAKAEISKSCGVKINQSKKKSAEKHQQMALQRTLRQSENIRRQIDVCKT